MRVGSSNETINLIKLKDESWADKQRVAGKAAAKALSHLQKLVEERTNLSTLELSKVAEEIILSESCLPTFKGYMGFPEACCISVNNELVHGIPRDFRLKEGDLVSFDLGATYGGVIADSAITCIYGNPKTEEYMKLIKTASLALEEAIKKIKVGAQMGAIGHAIYKTARDNGFSVIEKYGGHGICTDEKGNGVPHAHPFIANKDSSNNGVRIQPGMAFAIEPLLVIGNDTATKVMEDGWTVMAANISCHVEHSVFVHQDRVEVMTRRPDENQI